MKIPEIPRFARNFYTITSFLFIVWMLFFDSNDFITQYKTWKKLKDIESYKAYYLEKIEEVKKDRNELLSNQQLLEKFAREKYLMKKKTEDIYIITEAE